MVVKVPSRWRYLFDTFLSWAMPSKLAGTSWHPCCCRTSIPSYPTTTPPPPDPPLPPGPGCEGCKDGLTYRYYKITVNGVHTQTPGEYAGNNNIHCGQCALLNGVYYIDMMTNVISVTNGCGARLNFTTGGTICPSDDGGAAGGYMTAQLRLINSSLPNIGNPAISNGDGWEFSILGDFNFKGMLWRTGIVNGGLNTFAERMNCRTFTHAAGPLVPANLTATPANTFLGTRYSYWATSPPPSGAQHQYWCGFMAVDGSSVSIEGAPGIP